MQLATERVERPGESQEALDGKKTHTEDPLIWDTPAREKGNQKLGLRSWCLFCNTQFIVRSRLPRVNIQKVVWLCLCVFCCFRCGLFVCRVSAMESWRRLDCVQVPYQFAFVGHNQWRPLFFFCRRPLPFGGSPLEAYSRTSGESNHHRQSPTEPRGHLTTNGGHLYALIS